ncbi:mortality factor 4-like protein 1 [Trichonephila clavata]|uniref:Mortality factor 4-like protein 1 n=1 Tax=Trichonephila clavata TaxID=2740835 RepID=A0A8X6GGA8_TRICU|nr:mortality factor 4-like protein 1 [Trichonephila clavata]
MMSPKPRFIEGEKVLCFHGPLLYEAKCLRAQLRDKHMKYLIHYSGWNKNWDEWVPDCRVLKYNDVNLQKQKELEKTHKKSKKSRSIKMVVKKDTEKEATPPAVVDKIPKPRLEKKPSTSPPPPPPEPAPEEIEPEETSPRIVCEPCFAEEVEIQGEVKITIPPILKNWLIDDDDLVVRQKKIMQVPARITVDHIIASYVKQKVSVKGLSQRMEITIVQIANRIRDCFNVLLGNMLLQKFERPQYAEMLAKYPDLKMCQIYGATHLLRMFGKLGGMLTPISTPRGVMSALVEHIEDFVRFMAVNPGFFVIEEYVVAAPEYHRRALG